MASATCKYQATLTTTNSAVTPSLSSVQVCFVDTAATSATSLAVAPATGTFGGTTTLSATLTSSAVGVSGETVNFTLNGSSVGGAITNGSGVATLSGVSLAGINAGSYPTGVGASFPGDASYDPSSGSALADGEQGRPGDQRDHARAGQRRLQHGLLRRRDRRRLGQRRHLLQQRRLLEHRRQLHDDERHRHLLGHVRPGRQFELQRRAAGDRDGQRAEGRARRST